jgi:hypothetical protein
VKYNNIDKSPARPVGQGGPKCKNTETCCGFYYISPKKMHMLQSLFYLTTALLVKFVVDSFGIDSILFTEDSIQDPFYKILEQLRS